jgi:hypothetical protein
MSSFFTPSRPAGLYQLADASSMWPTTAPPKAVARPLWVVPMKKPAALAELAASSAATVRVFLMVMSFL